MDTQEQLAWEARQRPRAAIAALVAGLLSIAGGVYSGTTFSDVPRTPFFGALDDLAKPGPIGSLPSLRLPLYEWYHDHFSQFLISAVISSLGALAMGATLTFLAYATAARRAQLPRAALFLPAIGGVLLAIADLLTAIGTDRTVSRILDGGHSVDAVANAGSDVIATTGQLIGLVAGFALGISFVLVCLNAMRAGLLTRFMGVLGIIAGVLLALPIFGGPIPVVQSFWLIAFGVLLAGRWPGGAPRAWETGEAIPWPTQAEVREARMAGAGGKPASAPAADPAPKPAPGKVSPATSKKKRKRRG